MAITEEMLLEIAVTGLAKFAADMAKADKAVEKSGGLWGRVGKAASGAGKILQGVGKTAILGVAGAATAAVGAVGGLAAGLAKLAIEAAPIKAVEQAFQGLTQSFEGGSAAMLGALQDASAGMVTNRDLMMSFNKAAGLVSKDFAEQLPDAMGYLSKVAASTGQDMDFMLNSLITGVGRLSPMILDNLNIQVSLAEATEKASEMFGVEADELTKAQQQAGMMNVVLEKLEANTADMPDVAGSAAAGIASLGVMFQNVKDDLGKALLPALSTLMATFRNILDRVLPPLVSFFKDSVVPVIERVAFFIDSLVAAFLAGQDPISAFMGAFREIGLDAVADQMGQIVTRIQELIDQVRPYVEQAWAWIEQNVQLKDVLIALGIAVLSVVVPAIVSLLTTILPIIAVIVGLIAIVALLRKVWEEDIGGIRTALTNFWEGTAKPALAALAAWLKEHVPKAIATLKDFWEKKLLPAMQAIWAFITETLIPTLKEIAETAKKVVGEAIRKLSDIWETILYPALSLVWDFIQNSIIPLFEAVAEVAEAVLGLAIEVLAGIWENVLYPALSTVWSFIKEKVNPIFEKAAGVAEDTLGPPLQWLADTVLPALRDAFQWVADKIEAVIEWLKELAEKIENISLPGWLTGHSPPPLANWLDDIAAAAQQLATQALPQLTMQLQVAGQAAEPVAAMARSGSRGTVNNYSTTYHNYNLTTQTAAQATSLKLDFADMAMAKR